MATRKQVRERLGELMQTELVGDGHALVYASKGPRGLTDGKWPVALLGSVGSLPNRPARMNTGQTVHRLRLSVLVLYAAVDDLGRLLTRPDGSYEWTETNAIDTLDAINAELVAFFAAHRTEADMWSAIDYAEQSAIEIVDVGGVAYLRENYELALTC
ncbi:MAG TPA: hypothetical protein PLC98_15835 [Anaerolineales bacterium]|nr:hypothetical protein [Anaerolineales bacterium]